MGPMAIAVVGLRVTRQGASAAPLLPAPVGSHAWLELLANPKFVISGLVDLGRLQGHGPIGLASRDEDSAVRKDGRASCPAGVRHLTC